MPTLLENISSMTGSYLFGIELKDTEVEKQKRILKSPVPPSDDDGALISIQGVQSGAGALSSFLDYGKVINNENELITKYRDMALHPEVNIALMNIINEMVVQDEKLPSVSIVLDDLDEVDDTVKETIRDEFDRILRLLKFKTSAYNLVRYWYIDGKLFLNVLIDFDNPKKGIQELRYVDPRKIKYVKKMLRKRDQDTMQLMHTSFEEYFLYNPNGLGNQQTAWKLAKDTVVFAHSGLLDKNGNTVLSHLHQALRSLNQVRMLEDSMVIYRLARAPERRVFVIDVESVPISKAQAYVEDIMRRHKNKIVYNPQTGQIDSTKRFMTMTDDYYIPTRGGKGTQINSLPGAQNLGQIEDVQLFKTNLHRALNVPESRFQEGGAFNLGRSSEITRDEVNFQLFVDRLRTQFSQVFDQLLRIQLVLKGVCSIAEWDRWRDFITYRFQRNNYFTELKEQEIWTNRFTMLQTVDQFRNLYVDREWIWENVLRFDEDEIEEMRERIEIAKAEEGPSPLEQQQQMMGMPFDGQQDPSMMGDQPPMPDDPNAPQDGVPWDAANDQGESDPNAPSNMKAKFGQKKPKKPSPFPQKKAINADVKFKRPGDVLTEDQKKLCSMFQMREEINNLKEELNDYLEISING